MASRSARRTLLLAVCLSLAMGTAAAAAPVPTTGTLVDAAWLRWYPAWYLRLTLWYADLPGHFPVATGATLHRISYWTQNYAGVRVRASGLIAIPHATPLRGVVGYLHGTTSDARNVPSTPNVEGKLIAAVFAGGGYLVVAPDYIGLGRYRGLHPYLHADSAVSAALDLLRAARRYCEQTGTAWPANVNLLGVSQGGHAAAALQRRLEALSDPAFQVRAAATAGAPFDLAGISFPFALAGGSRSHAAYLAYMVDAYARIYGHPLASVLREPYASRVPGLFDGNHGIDEVAAALPRRPRDLFDLEFLAAFDRGEPTWLLEALAANEAFRWSPHAPLRLYYGDRDANVAPEEARHAAAAMAALGGRAQAVSVGDLGHQDSALQAVAIIRAWFDTLNPSP